MILYDIPSKIEQLLYSAAILDAILNCKNAKSVSLVHPPDSLTSWSKALKNAKKRLLPNISRFNTPVTGLSGYLPLVWGLELQGKGFRYPISQNSTCFGLAA